MRMERHESPIVWNIVISKELPCNTGIFTGDIVSFFEDSECTKRDILKITDGGWDDGKHRNNSKRTFDFSGILSEKEENAIFTQK